MLEGELDLSDLDFPTEGRRALEGASNRDVVASEAGSPAPSAAPEAARPERTEPKSRRAPFRRRKRQAIEGSDPSNGQGDDE